MAERPFLRHNPESATAFSGNKQSDAWNKKVDICNRNKNKVLIRLIILESNITDEEGVLSKGVYVRKGLMFRGSFVWRGFCLRRFCPCTGCPI